FPTGAEGINTRGRHDDLENGARISAASAVELAENRSKCIARVLGAGCPETVIAADAHRISASGWEFQGRQNFTGNVVVFGAIEAGHLEVRREIAVILAA